MKNKNKFNFILNEPDITKKYEMVIDYLINYLDTEININELCDFVDGKCIANRLNKSVHKDNGCCYQHKKGLCPFLVNGKCSISCVSCKLFVCSYLEKKVGKIRIEKIFPMHLVFNKKQIYLLKRSFFIDKKELINLLLKNRK